jgi:cell division septum initiation protein DivIVA
MSAESVDLDRETITGRTFTSATDGYHRQEVDDHLSAIVRALEAQATDGLVHDERSILGGARESAAALREAVEQDAREIAEAAQRDAQATRARAAEEAGSRVAATRAAVKSLLERAEALGVGVEETQAQVRGAADALAGRLEEDVAPYLDTLRQRGQTLGAELDLMGSGFAGGTVSAASRRTNVGTGLGEGDLDEAADVLAVAEEPAAGEPAPPPLTPAATSGGGGAGERARLMALDMAVKGRPREEAERRLREELGLDDPAGVLDEVYARPGT